MSGTPLDTERVLNDVREERKRQIAKGWTTEHDDQHATHELAELAVDRLRTSGAAYSRKSLVEGAAMLVAAVEAIDRA